MPDTQVTVADAADERRYEARAGDDLAGVLEYRDVRGRRILAHTEVLPAFEGRGIGGALARHALDEAKALGRRVTVKCPFVRSWLDRHPGYEAIVIEAPSRDG